MERMMVFLNLLDKLYLHFSPLLESQISDRNLTAQEVFKMCGMFDIGKSIKEKFMNHNIRKLFLSTTLAGALVMGMGVEVAYGQNPNEPPPGTRADNREDRQ